MRTCSARGATAGSPAARSWCTACRTTCAIPPDYYASTDWTDGCIALSDSDMVEFWLLSHDNMPIEITP